MVQTAGLYAYRASCPAFRRWGALSVAEALRSAMVIVGAAVGAAVENAVGRGVQPWVLDVRYPQEYLPLGQLMQDAGTSQLFE
jgi:hypothetical protein